MSPFLKRTFRWLYAWVLLGYGLVLGAGWVSQGIVVVHEALPNAPELSAWVRWCLQDRPCSSELLRVLPGLVEPTLRNQTFALLAMGLLLLAHSLLSRPSSQTVESRRLNRDPRRRP